MNELDAQFWSDRYKTGAIGWDLGQVSPPIKEYFDKVNDKNVRILIPGCGNAYEAEYLFMQGFSNVHVMDLAQEPLNAFAKRVPNFPKEHIHCVDFFAHHSQYDFIIEQTLFCAIDPLLREAYAQKAHELLTPGGKIVGLLFNRDFEGGPPFGGNAAEYQTLFEKYFSMVKITPCLNSIPPRMGTEVWVEMVK